MTAPSSRVPSNLITKRRSLRAAGGLAAGVLSLAAVVGSAPQFRSGVNAVEVYASVTDPQGAPVTGLSKGDFEVSEDGTVQEITLFAAGEFPLAAAIALDHSFSMAGPRLTNARNAARSFLGELRPEDESMLIGVGSRIEVLAPLSSDRAAQYRVLDTLEAFGTTGLYDAIVAALEAMQPARGRRALILLSDGDDRYSRATAAEALERARASDVLVYPIAFGRTRPSVFAELAAVSGGRSYHVKDPRQLTETLRTISAELRNQYLLGYTPSKPIVSGDREWRAIAVRVARPGANVRARDGYLVR